MQRLATVSIPNRAPNEPGVDTFAKARGRLAGRPRPRRRSRTRRAPAGADRLDRPPSCHPEPARLRGPDLDSRSARPVPRTDSSAEWGDLAAPSFANAE